MAKLDINALFLGPKSENEDFFRDMLTFMINDHISWRKYFHPDDAPLGADSKQDPSLTADTLERTREALLELAANLQTGSVPWFSPRYLGHMTTDTLMASLLGYMLTLLYNPNNCAYEASAATTVMEVEVGKQLAALMGFPKASSFGHITSGGTVANYEGMWLARNTRSVPFAVQRVMPALVEGLSFWELANMPRGLILRLLEQVQEKGQLQSIRESLAFGLQSSPFGVGKWIVPQSKHYSWVKGVDILGIGQHNLEFVDVNHNYRMNVEHLRSILDRCLKEQTPVLGVVCVVGSTEEGAVDEVHKVVALRQEYEKQGLWFHIHVDAAYGGYARSMFMDDKDCFASLETVRESLSVHGGTYPPEDVYQAFQAMSFADSITVDPHKLGYIPYAAGAILIPDRRVLDTISYFAAYVFEKNETSPLLLGSYIMEGSKAGAVAASVWTAHRVVPLHRDGYGRIIGNSIDAAYGFYAILGENKIIKSKGLEFEVHCLTKPDLNIVIYAFNEKGNKDLAKMNRLNQKIYELFSYRFGPVYSSDFLLSKTSLSKEEYGDRPWTFVSQFGIPETEWERVEEVYVIRSCIMNPLLSETKYKTYWELYIATLQERLASCLD